MLHQEGPSLRAAMGSSQSFRSPASGSANGCVAFLSVLPLLADRRRQRVEKRVEHPRKWRSLFKRESLQRAGIAAHRRGLQRESVIARRVDLVQIYGDLPQDDRNGRARGNRHWRGSLLLPNAAIEADGIHHVFVGTDLNGTIRSLGSLTVWIGGNFGGHCHTGHPSTHLHVDGDVSGQFEPTREGVPALP